MKNGICPKCQSKEVYVTQQGGPNSASIAIGWLTSFQLEGYICLSCGLSEQYMIAEDLQDVTKISGIREAFKKLRP